MSASHNSSGSSTTAVSPDATQAVQDQISALGSTSPGWLSELRNLGYVPNSATPTTGTIDSTGANSGIGGAVFQPVGNVATSADGSAQMQPGLLAAILGNKYKGAST